jgi:hypothetical protein
MKHQAKLVLFGILSLLIGVAFASPLLVSELSIRPFIKHVQGPTADFSVNVVYANFTILNGSKPVSKNDGPAISYYVVLNVTNLSDVGAKLLDVDFVAAGQISNTSTSFVMNSISGSGYEVEGAWVDSVWYNVTYVTGGGYPRIDINGTVIESPWGNVTWFEPYWMEGVQIMDTYANGTLTATYMNMNGTWTDVTGRINFTRPEGTDPSKNAVWVSDTVVREFHAFQDIEVLNFTSTTKSDNNTFTDSEIPEDWKTKYTWVGEDLFDNYWAPHQSRLIVLQGIRSIIKPWADAKAIDTLKSGSITLQTRLFNDANVTVKIVNGTIADTWSYVTERKQVQLTQNGDSYVYNTILGENQIFLTDQYGVEVFIETRR